MGVVRIDIDDEALATATRLMGTTSAQDAVNTALREYVAWASRLEAAAEAEAEAEAARTQA